MVETSSEYWFADEMTPENRARTLAGTVDSIIQRHMARWQAYDKYASLYRGYQGGLSCKYAGADSVNAFTALISLNGVKSCVDTAVSKVATKNRPKPMFVTNGADFDTRMLAKDVEEFVNGVLFQTRAYTAAERSFQDAACYGEGFAKTFVENKRIVVRALHPWEVIIDELEGRFGPVPSIYHVRYVDRFTLARTYPEFKEQIMRCVPEADALRAFHIQDTIGAEIDMIRLVEGWRTDERHTVAINNQILFDGRIEGGSPISKILWGSDPVVDVFGCGIAEQAHGLQVEVNTLLSEISEGHHLIKGYLALENGAEVVTEKINNDLRRILRYSTTMPQYVVPQIIAPEVYEHLWALYAKIFEVTGIAQVNATGAHPEGLTSAVGQRTFQDVQTERFLKTVRGYEEFVIDISGNVVGCADEDMSVRANSGTRLAESIQWTQAMAELDAEIRVYPGSMLPDTPAGRMSWGQDMLQLGADPGTVLETIGIQDPDSIMRRMLSRRFVIQKNIASIIRKAKYVSPEPSDDHELALQLVNDAYHEARLDDVPEDRKLMLLKYMQVTEDFIERMKAEAAAKQASAAQAAQPAQPQPPTAQQV
jgi:hypothetical protein